MLFRSPHSLLWRDLDTYPEIDQDLTFVVDDPNAELPPYLSLTLLQEDLDLDTDLVVRISKILTSPFRYRCHPRIRQRHRRRFCACNNPFQILRYRPLIYPLLFSVASVFA